MEHCSSRQDGDQLISRSFLYHERQHVHKEAVEKPLAEADRFPSLGSPDGRRWFLPDCAMEAPDPRYADSPDAETCTTAISEVT
jgi:hypothetical protein